MSRTAGEGPALPESAAGPGVPQPASRRQLRALLALFLLILAVRLLSVYPPTLRHDPAHIALQALRILGGERPIFWSGQAWMGAAGTYGEAALFALFGKSTLVMSLYAWLLSGVWVGLSLLLAWRFFGPRAALIAAAIWLVPTATMMYWSSQARNDFHLLFIATPAILLAARRIVMRHRAGRGIGWWSLGFGFLCGFSFWQNMAIGPCLVVTFAVLMAHLGRTFWSRFVWLYSPAWFLGFAPVILYNARNGFPIFGQSSGLSRPATVAKVGAAFVENAFPRLWGIELQGHPWTLRDVLQTGFLLWVVLLVGLFAASAYRRWRRREDTLAEQLTLGLLAFHLLVLLVTGYGSSFSTPGNPVLYITNLLCVAIAVPAAVIARGALLPRWALALPLAVYVVGNLEATAPIAEGFFAALAGQGWAAVQHFPDPRDQTTAFLAGQGLEHGYLDESLAGARLNLVGAGRVESARPFAERVVDYSLRADAAPEIFWFASPGLRPQVFRTLGARFQKSRLGPRVIYHHFRREERSETLIEAYSVETSHQPESAAFLSDRRAGTVWSLPEPLPEAWVRFDFGEPQPVGTITLLPKDAGSLPRHILAQTSADGTEWKTAAEWRRAGPFFWSVRHPFKKSIKPRGELVVERPEPARFLRLLFPQQRGRCAIREAYPLRVEPAAAPSLTLGAEIATITEALAPLRGTHRIVGDHYFMSYFKLRGHEVEFLPNRTVDNEGRRNPFIVAELPVDFSRPLCFIVPAAHARSVERTLDAGRIAYRSLAYPRHELLVTEPAAAAPLLYWSGIDLLETSAARRRRR